MRIADMTWMEVEAYLRRDDRAVLPVGSVEQHAFLSLATDAILAERVAVEAAEPLGVPVYPALAYGVSPHHRAWPGTVTLTVETFLRAAREILDCLFADGFRRIVVVNGHGGNAPLEKLAPEWTAAHPGAQVKVHHWWRAPNTWAKIQAVDPASGHASWMESFPWTRVASAAPPDGAKPLLDPAVWRALSPAALRAAAGDGCFGGHYRRSDDEARALWAVAVEEARSLLEGPWTVG